MPGSFSHTAQRVLICLGLSCFAWLNAASAQDISSASFGDWHTFCDKENICDAYTYSGWESSQNPSSGDVFALRRLPTGGGWLMSITFDQVEPKLALGLSASVIRYGHHDQTPVPEFQQSGLSLRGGRIGNGLAGNHQLYLSGSSAETVMARLRLGDILDFEFGGCRDEFLYTGFSLAGITAALAWIDEVQGLPSGSVKIARIAPGTQKGPASNCGE